MELKSRSIWQVNALLSGSNRTFMELKLLFALHRDAPRAVLIVPLWN